MKFFLSSNSMVVGKILLPKKHTNYTKRSLGLICNNKRDEMKCRSSAEIKYHGYYMSNN